MATGLIDRTSRSLLPVTLAFAAGVGAASRVVFPAAAMTAALVALAVILLWAYFSGRRRFAILLLLPSFFLTGLWHGAPAFRPPDDPHHVARLLGETHQDVVLAGFLAGAAEKKEERTRVLLAVAEVRRPEGAIPAHGLVRLTVNGSIRQQLLPGDPVLVRTRVGPHRSHRVPGAMDYRTFLHRQGIWLAGWAETPLHVVPLTPSPPRPVPLAFLPERLRAQADEQIRQLAPAASVPLYRALLTGSRGDVPEKVLEHFKATGAMHLLAISGMHLGLVTLLFAGLATWLLKRSTWLLLHLPARKLALLLTLIPLLGYAGITGLQPPAVRALIMVLVFIAAIFLDRQWCSLNNLAVAALLILLVEPACLLGVSFQLSFTATAAIILAYRFRLPLLPIPQGSFSHRLGAWLLTGLTISVVATCATAPLSLLYFNRLSVLSPVSTLLLSPLLCFWVIPLGLLGLALAAPLPVLAGHLFTAGNWGIAAALTMAETLAKFPWASFFLPTPTLLEVAAGLAMLLALLAWRRGRTARIAALALCAMLVASPPIRHAIRLADPSSRVSFLDVGQGSAVVVELPHGKTVLIDAGGMDGERFNIGERLVAPFLWGRGISHLDAVVVSHPHTDHWNGLPFLIERFRPATLWINGDRQGEGDYAALLARAEAMGIAIKVPQAGEILARNGAASLRNVAALHLVPAKGRPDPNNQSLVLQLRHGSQACLLPGDIDSAHEEILVAKRAVASTVLLAPHHGSRHSSSPKFITAVRPRTIVVSAQGGPRARFPHPEKRKMWQEMGIPILVTGVNGTIGVRMEGENLQIAPLGD
ncbi:MAG: DNA internalization-related competence protein ComEC/Rec2 [Thermodesulfobacteriota bacterium]